MRIVLVGLALSACGPLVVGQVQDGGSGGGAATGGGSAAMGGGTAAMGGGAAAMGGGAAAMGGGAAATGGGTAATGGGGAETFDAGFDFAIAAAGFNVKAADLNADGKPDIVVLTTNSVSFLVNTTSVGSNTPTFAPYFDIQEVNGGLQKLAVGDLNSDGRPEVVAMRNGLTANLYVNSTDAGALVPSFAKQALTFAYPARDAVITDLNADGKPDLAVRVISAQDPLQSTATVLLNTTPASTFMPTFAMPVDFFAPSPASPGAITVGDFNGDGKPDLATDSFVLFNGTDAGALVPAFPTQAGTPTPVSTMRTTVVSADFNGDGRVDLAFGGGPTGEVLLNLSSGFVSTQLMTPGVPYGIATADFDGDGKPDLFTVGVSYQAFSILLNRTSANAQTPTFAPSVDTYTAGAWAGALADFNGDGKLDVVVTTPQSTVSVYLAQ
jgi:hypothetical protein